MSEYDELLGNVPKETKETRVQPVEIKVVPKIVGKNCRSCEQYHSKENYLRSNSWFFRDGYCEICNDCLRRKLGDGTDLELADKLCQYLDIPFHPELWIRLLSTDKVNWFKSYSDQNWTSEYENLDWKSFMQEWKEIRERGEEHKHVDLMKEEDLKKLREKWGAYTNEQLTRFEQLYKDIEATQSITTAIQQDNARKMCMLSYRIEESIWNDEIKASDSKALITAYNDLAKAADFTPKTAKNVGDFESVGELYGWLEKLGWLNEYYNWTPRDEVDKVIQIMQTYTKRIVMGETNIAEELSEKLDMVQNIAKLEKEYLDASEDFEMTMVDDDVADELNEEFEVNS